MKTVMITGANVGIGKDAARQLALIDGVEKIFLACRNQSKADAARQDLEQVTGKNIFEVVIMDTSDLASVRQAVASLDGVTLDGLVLNAGGPRDMDLTSDGVTMSFAANVLGHVVLTEELIQAGKLTGTVIFSSSEAVRGIPALGTKGVALKESSVEEFKNIANGSYVEALKSSDPRLETYAVVKYTGVLWTSYMARQHPNMRFVSVSPGATQGTNVMSHMSGIARAFMAAGMKVYAWFGGAHGLATGAKRYVDVLVDAEKYKTGEFYASAKGASGPMVVQSEATPSITDYKDTNIQDNAVKAIHDIINQEDFENKFKS